MSEEKIYRLSELGPDMPLESLPPDAIIQLNDSELFEEPEPPR